jgi:hypothetical protein
MKDHIEMRPATSVFLVVYTAWTALVILWGLPWS